MTEKPSVKLPGKVEKIFRRTPDEPEKAQISIDKADPLYREIRIENSLKDVDGDEVRLEENDEVDVTVETEKDTTSEPGTHEHQREFPSRKTA
jgi:hypothetical protein